MEFNQVIIIDDDLINSQLCKMVFMRTYPKIDFMMYEDAELLLRAIRAHQFVWKPTTDKTILLLDIDMPRMDGWEFLEEYSLLAESDRNHFFLYILSSSSNPADVARARNNPLVRKYFVKPLTHHIIDDINRDISAVS